MPGSTGIDLARNLWETQPDLRVLFMSGYAEDLGGAERLPRSRFLAKPFTPSTLLRALDEVLAEAAEPQSD